MQMVYPMFCLILLTFAVGLGLGSSRFLSVRKGHVNARYYKLFTGDEPPEYVQKLGRNFSNLLEVPMFFYILGVLLIALNIQNANMLLMAWAYVLLRVAHSIIHITYNNPIHRFTVFFISGLLVLAMWIHFVLIVSNNT